MKCSLVMKVYNILQDSSLPEGWEERRTSEGRVSYVDHNTKTYSWDHPNSQKKGLGPMPAGWEVKQMADDRLFFVDHSESTVHVKISFFLKLATWEIYVTACKRPQLPKINEKH